MALWPFRRRSGRKRSRSGAALSDVEGAPPLRSQTEGVVARAASKKKQRTEPQKLHRRARTYSFSPGRYDDIRTDRDTSAPERTGRTGKHNNAAEEFGAWDRTPTLHHNHHPTRRKSSKRRREEHDREAEIKAMSNFMPVRPATDQWNAGRPMKKDSKRAKTMGFGRHRDNSVSEVSLPVPGSIHSSLSSDSEFGSYKVSALDALAPRPTLRYAQGSRAPVSHSSIPNRTGSQRKRLADREPIPEETLKAHKRIDDLADDLDSSDLRELMERDNRRREQKKQREQERMERRLARRVEKQKAEEVEAKKSGTPPPENLERGVMGRELVGLGIEPKSAVVTSSKQRTSVESVQMTDADAVEESPKQPYESFHRTDTAPSEEPTAVEEASKQESIPPRRSDEQASMSTGTKFSGLLRSVKSRSKSTLGSERDKMASPPPGTINEEDVLRKDSESSTKGGRFSFSSFIRWGGKSRRNSGPSSFSNTSREEMQAAATARAAAEAQAQALARLQGEDTSIKSGHYMARKANAPPKRTRSRFREDLPEFPVSPPASRVQSPETEPPLPALSEHKRSEMESLRSPGLRYDTPTSGHRSIEAMRQTPTSMEGAYVSPSPEPHMSMSLASIDSEGSWLSGKVGARKAAMRESLMRANRREQGDSSSGSPSNSTQEDLAITEDEYLSKLTPRRNSTHVMGRRSGEGRPSSDEEDLVDDFDMKWGAVGSHPQVIRTHNHDRFTMKSHEGLLDIESEIEEDGESSPVSPSPSEMVDVQRARSVNLGRGHVRNFSAGSAKLLDITPRASVDDRRKSSSRRGSNAVIV
ncbi:Fc.00g092340.m01.CDS01 [Cosmosporella sp. VM-42]